MKAYTRMTRVFASSQPERHNVQQQQPEPLIVPRQPRSNPQLRQRGDAAHRSSRGGERARISLALDPCRKTNMIRVQTITPKVVNAVVNAPPVVNHPAPEPKPRHPDEVSKRQPGSKRSSLEALRTYHRLDMQRRRERAKADQAALAEASF